MNHSPLISHWSLVTRKNAVKPIECHDSGWRSGSIPCDRKYSAVQFAL
ncbi:MAG: hypothetical protein WBL95_16935 [Microcoleus sp.]